MPEADHYIVRLSENYSSDLEAMFKVEGDIIFYADAADIETEREFIYCSTNVGQGTIDMRIPRNNLSIVKRMHK